MTQAGDQIVATLDEMGPSVAVAFRLSMESYFDVLRALVETFATQKDLQVIYVGSSIPYATMVGASSALEVDIDRVHFVDSVSRMVMGEIVHDDRVQYVEAPTMLESILLKVELLDRRLGSVKKLVVIDSINSLSLHNDVKSLSEFMQILLSRLGQQESYPVILYMDDQSRPEVEELLNLVCDDVITIGAPETLEPSSSE